MDWNVTTAPRWLCWVFCIYLLSLTAILFLIDNDEFRKDVYRTLYTSSSQRTISLHWNNERCYPPNPIRNGTLRQHPRTPRPYRQMGKSLENSFIGNNIHLSMVYPPSYIHPTPPPITPPRLHLRNLHPPHPHPSSHPPPTNPHRNNVLINNPSNNHAPIPILIRRIAILDDDGRVIRNRPGTRRTHHLHVIHFGKNVFHTRLACTR